MPGGDQLWECGQCGWGWESSLGAREHHRETGHDVGLTYTDLFSIPAVDENGDDEDDDEPPVRRRRRSVERLDKGSILDKGSFAP